jgi:hypothetical protein
MSESNNLNVDVFNLMKYRILSAVALLNSIGCPATSKNIWYHMYGNYKYPSVTGRIQKMTYRELTPKHQKKSINGCRFVYKLSAQGKRNLKGYQERHKNNLNLRLKKLPQRMNWDHIQLIDKTKIKT